MLLLYLINEDDLGPSFPEGIKQNGGGNSHEQEVIQKYKQDEEPINLSE